nr:hypothetical protein [Paenibacillus sp.]
MPTRNVHSSSCRSPAINRAATVYNGCSPYPFGHQSRGSATVNAQSYSEMSAESRSSRSAATPPSGSRHASRSVNPDPGPGSDPNRSTRPYNRTVPTFATTSASVATAGSLSDASSCRRSSTPSHNPILTRRVEKSHL